MARVLIIDDHIDSNDSLATLFKFEGFEVVQAFAGEEAIRLAIEHRPDVAILDLSLPGKSGIEVASEMRSHAALQQMNTVAYTAHTGAALREKALHAGCDKYLVKPTDPDTLIDAVRRLRSGYPRILFIDDNEVKRYTCCSTLRRNGILVFESFSGEHALSVLGRHRPQLVITDAGLPDVSGYELCRRIKKTVNVPVVLVSFSPLDRDKAALCGIDGYVEDFSDEAGLLGAVKQHIRRDERKD